MKELLFYLPGDIPQDCVDILLITGDAYIDHPSFGIAIIARLLESKGYSICIVSQPRYYDNGFLELLPVPRLFIGITSGNLDSVVSNYSANRIPRKDDAYSIGGEAFFENGKKKRPDRALSVYTSFLRQRFKDIPIVIGGLEASIRRFSHYDFVQQKLRKSALIDAKADLLIYSMGERAVCEVASRLSEKLPLSGIYGTMIRLNESEFEAVYRKKYDPVVLPSFEEIDKDHFLLVQATKTVEANIVPGKSMSLAQNNGGIYVLSFPPQDPLDMDKLDGIYNLPFKKDFPEYCHDVPAWNMIKDSLTSHRGCYGKCSFCAIFIHQGPVISQRSEGSVVKEAAELAVKPFFKKTLTDVGGPTANMYGTTCKIGWCREPHCLFPEKCENLYIDQLSYKKLLKAVKEIPGIKNVFVSSGLRHDLALMKEDETEYIIAECTSGHLKIAPEHVDERILKLMRKPANTVFERFLSFFDGIKKRFGLKSYILPYLIISYPGSDEKSAEHLADFLCANSISTHQYQDFTPVPGTMATAYYYSGKDEDGNELEIPKTGSQSQRNILKDILTKKK